MQFGHENGQVFVTPVDHDSFFQPIDTVAIVSDTEIETIDLGFKVEQRDTGQSLSFLPLKVQDERRAKQSQTGKRSTTETNAEPNRDKRRDKRRSNAETNADAAHTTHTNTNIHLLLFSLGVGMDWAGVKPGLGWLNGITHDIFLDYFFDELILFLWSICLMCQMMMSGNESGRVCSTSLFGSESV